MDMTEQEQRAVLVLCLQAAFADGSKADAERDEVKRIAEGFPDAAVDLPRLYQDVLMKRVTPAEAARDLASSEARQLAYEMALCICVQQRSRSLDLPGLLSSLSA